MYSFISLCFLSSEFFFIFFFSISLKKCIFADPVPGKYLCLCGNVGMRVKRVGWPWNISLPWLCSLNQQLKHLLLYLGTNLEFHWHNNYFINLLTLSTGLKSTAGEVEGEFDNTESSALSLISVWPSVIINFTHYFLIMFAVLKHCNDFNPFYSHYLRENLVLFGEGSAEKLYKAWCSVVFNCWSSSQQLKGCVT